LCPAGHVVIITTLHLPEPFVTPFLSLLGTAALVAAPAEPGASDKAGRYQKLAEGLAWAAPDEQETRSLQEQLSGYVIDYGEVRAINDNTRTIRILKAGKEVCAWEDRGARAFLARGDVLYRADYTPISSGCAIIAVDLKSGKDLWSVSLKGLGPIDHSKYRNRVWMEPVDDSVLTVYGHESAGRYVELVDWKTGKTLGHKVFPRE
jgi:hypothetical protein